MVDRLPDVIESGHIPVLLMLENSQQVQRLAMRRMHPQNLPVYFLCFHQISGLVRIQGLPQRFGDSRRHIVSVTLPCDEKNRNFSTGSRLWLNQFRQLADTGRGSTTRRSNTQPPQRPIDIAAGAVEQVVAARARNLPAINPLWHGIAPPPAEKLQTLESWVTPVSGSMA